MSSLWLPSFTPVWVELAPVCACAQGWRMCLKSQPWTAPASIFLMHYAIYMETPQLCWHWGGSKRISSQSSCELGARFSSSWSTRYTIVQCAVERRTTTTWAVGQHPINRKAFWLQCTCTHMFIRNQSAQSKPSQLCLDGLFIHHEGCAYTKRECTCDDDVCWPSHEAVFIWSGMLQLTACDKRCPVNSNPITITNYSITHFHYTSTSVWFRVNHTYIHIRVNHTYIKLNK